MPLSQTTAFEPLRTNLFRIEFPGFDIPNDAVLRVDRPKTDKNYNWLPLEMTFTNQIGLSVNSKLIEIYKHCRKQRFYNPSWFQRFYKPAIDTLKNRKPGPEWLFVFKLITIDPTGEDIETWEIKVEDVKFDFNDNDYQSDTIQTTDLIIYPYECKLMPS